MLQSKTTSGVEMSYEASDATRTSNYIGHSISTSNADSHVYLDDLRVYSDRDVSSADVAAIYAKRNA